MNDKDIETAFEGLPEELIEESRPRGRKVMWPRVITWAALALLIIAAAVILSVTRCA